MLYRVSNTESQLAAAVAVGIDVEDLPQLKAHMLACLNAMKSQSTVLVDARNTPENLRYIVEAANMFKDVLGHPNVGKRLMIVQSRIIAFAAKGLDTVTFGNLGFTFFQSDTEIARLIAEYPILENVIY